VDKLHFKECLIELLQVASPFCIQPYHVYRFSLMRGVAIVRVELTYRLDRKFVAWKNLI
jgi:hypothetical protein